MSDLSVNAWPLAYVDQLTPRPLESIHRVVIHCTELPDLTTAREFGEQVRHADGTGNSGHFYIDRDGSVHAFVPVDRMAHHVRGGNEHSVGIELVNTGRYPNWFDSRWQNMTEPYPEAQIEALTALLDTLCAELPALQHIAGHEDLDTAEVAASDDPDRTVARKRDPGPQFPWPRLMQKTTLMRGTSRPPAAG